jgi:hypothetical protein
MNWRADPAEPGFYLCKEAGFDRPEIVELKSETFGPGKVRMHYEVIGAGYDHDVEDHLRFLGPFTIAELEAFLLGRPA